MIRWYKHNLNLLLCGITLVYCTFLFYFFFVIETVGQEFSYQAEVMTEGE